MAAFTVHGDLRSGNCLKVKYVADYLGLAYDWRDLDVIGGAARTDEFRAINPMGQTPAIVFADGRRLAQSNAIIRYLARGSALLPDDGFAQAKIDEWLFWEQYSHEPYIAVARAQILWGGVAKDQRADRIVKGGEAALNLMERHLSESDGWFANGALSIADVALVAYTRAAPDGGFDLTPYPHIRAWIARSERALDIKG